MARRSVRAQKRSVKGPRASANFCRSAEPADTEASTVEEAVPLITIHLFIDPLSAVLLALTSLNDLDRIDSGLVDLHFGDLARLVDQISHTSRRLVAQLSDLLDHAIVFRGLAAPIAEQRESDANGIRECFVGERAIHAYTQDLGVRSFQSLQVLLEVLHLLGSTTGEGEDIKRQHDTLLALVIVQREVL